MNYIGILVAWLHNLWVKGPIDRANFVALWPAIQAVLIVLVFAGWESLSGYGWVIPAGGIFDWTGWFAELLNAGTAAWLVLLPIVTQRLWPAVVPYLLTLLQLIIAPPAAAGVFPVRRQIVLWVPAR